MRNARAGPKAQSAQACNQVKSKDILGLEREF